MNKRYDFAPIRRMFRDYENENGLVSDDTIALALGTSRNCIIRWRRQGIPAKFSDTVAVRAGRLPYEIWPEWLSDGVEELERREERRAAKRLANNARERERTAQRRAERKAAKAAC